MDQNFYTSWNFCWAVKLCPKPYLRNRFWWLTALWNLPSQSQFHVTSGFIQSEQRPDCMFPQHASQSFLLLYSVQQQQSLWFATKTRDCVDQVECFMRMIYDGRTVIYVIDITFIYLFCFSPETTGLARFTSTWHVMQLKILLSDCLVCITYSFIRRPTPWVTGLVLMSPSPTNSI